METIKSVNNKAWMEFYYSNNNYNIEEKPFLKIEEGEIRYLSYDSSTDKLNIKLCLNKEKRKMIKLWGRRSYDDEKENFFISLKSNLTMEPLFKDEDVKWNESKRKLYYGSSFFEGVEKNEYLCGFELRRHKPMSKKEKVDRAVGYGIIIVGGAVIGYFVVVPALSSAVSAGAGVVTAGTIKAMINGTTFSISTSSIMGAGAKAFFTHLGFVGTIKLIALSDGVITGIQDLWYLTSEKDYLIDDDSVLKSFFKLSSEVVGENLDIALNIISLDNYDKNAFRNLFETGMFEVYTTTLEFIELKESILGWKDSFVSLNTRWQNTRRAFGDANADLKRIFRSIELGIEGGELAFEAHATYKQIIQESVIQKKINTLKRKFLWGQFISLNKNLDGMYNEEYFGGKNILDDNEKKLEKEKVQHYEVKIIYRIIKERVGKNFKLRNIQNLELFWDGTFGENKVEKRTCYLMIDGDLVFDKIVDEEKFYEIISSNEGELEIDLNIKIYEIDTRMLGAGMLLKEEIDIEDCFVLDYSEMYESKEMNKIKDVGKYQVVFKPVKNDLGNVEWKDLAINN